ncbi:MAG: pitrilysin family protein [Planctomycetota bacterium]|nr:pitrilysin family protein [Planctomycetota bacterium]
MEFQQHRLDNGLQVIAEINPRAYSTSVGFFVSAGARDEDSQIAGVSHFLEHMAFKGTPNRTAEEVNRELDEMGSHSNARTGEERTIYHSTVLPEFQDRAVELLADILRPSLRTDDFEMEKKVICEEIMMYDDQPPFGGHEKIMASYFGDHALGQSILGTVETVSSLTPEQMKSYFEQRYSPGNIALVAAGRVDFQGLLRVAEQCCGHWPAVDAPRKLESAEPRLEFNCVEKETAAQQYLIQLCPGPATEEEDRYATRVLTSIFGDDSGSRLYWEFVDSGQAEYAGMGAYEYEKAGILLTFLCGNPETAEKNLERLVQMQKELLEGGVTESELELAKAKISSGIILGSERPENRMFAVGGNWLSRQEYKTVREVADCYDRLSVADLNRVVEKYPLHPSNTLAIGPLSEFGVKGS